ncbi:MAG: hypothetical protein HYZ09_01000 [Candidatus Kerfeldbacteria bacterium]|nr:hypothetical protein [Candidatus Kerfeldbacteria bacterium]
MKVQIMMSGQQLGLSESELKMLGPVVCTECRKHGTLATLFGQLHDGVIFPRCRNHASSQSERLGLAITHRSLALAARAKAFEHEQRRRARIRRLVRQTLAA